MRVVTHSICRRQTLPERAARRLSIADVESKYSSMKDSVAAVGSMGSDMPLILTHEMF
jgi:hypothetical protein